MKRFTCTLFFALIISGCLSACHTIAPNPTSTETAHKTENLIKNNHQLEKRLQELEQHNRQLKEKIAQLERRQNNLERSIAVIAERDSMADETASNTLADAQQAYQHKQYAKTLALLNRYLQENITPTDEPNALWLLAQSHTKLNNCESAVRTAHQLTQRYPENALTPDAFLLIAQCQNRLQQKDTAKTTLRALIAKYPNSRAAKKAQQLLK